MEEDAPSSPSINTGKSESGKNTSKEKSQNFNVGDRSKSPPKSGRRISLAKIKAK